MNMHVLDRRLLAIFAVASALTGCADGDGTAPTERLARRHRHRRPPPRSR